METIAEQKARSTRLRIVETGLEKLRTRKLSPGFCRRPLLVLGSTVERAAENRNRDPSSSQLRIRKGIQLQGGERSLRNRCVECQRCCPDALRHRRSPLYLYGCRCNAVLPLN